MAVALLESEPGVRHAYSKHFKMAGQWMAPPELRKGRLIVIDQNIVQRVLGELPASVLSELQAEFLDQDEPEQEECPPENPPPNEQLPLDCHLQALMGDQYGPDSPTFISPVTTNGEAGSRVSAVRRAGSSFRSSDPIQVGG